MDFSKPIWIGSPVDVRLGDRATEALSQISDRPYWNDEVGIVEVDEERWKKAQQYEKDCWMKHNTAVNSDRNHEHFSGFDGYSTLDSNIGDVIEIGCGPFTQLQTIISQAKKRPSTITLLDPLLSQYRKHPHCSYKHNTLSGIPVTCHSIPAEDFAAQNKFDTVICINVLEHVKNAMAILNNLYECLRDGGTIVFHDRAWDHIDINKLYDVGHPIRLKKRVLEEFMARFEALHYNKDYFIGLKS